MTSQDITLLLYPVISSYRDVVSVSHKNGFSKNLRLVSFMNFSVNS